MFGGGKLFLGAGHRSPTPRNAIVGAAHPSAAPENASGLQGRVGGEPPLQIRGYRLRQRDLRAASCCTLPESASLLCTLRGTKHICHLACSEMRHLWFLPLLSIIIL